MIRPATFDRGRREMIRRLRLGNLRKLFRDRYGPILPDDDAGREDLYELLLPISVGPHAEIKMPYAIEVWSPWMLQEEASQLIDQINLTPIWGRLPNAAVLGARLRLTNGERERLKLWTIAPHNFSPHELLQQRRAKDRERKRRLRQLRGCKSRAQYEANSTNRTMPWLALGIGRRTWYRRRGTSPSAVILQTAADTPVPPQLAQPPKKRLPEQAVTSKATKPPTRAEKSKRQKDRAPVGAVAHEVNGRTCAKGSDKPAYGIGHNAGPPLNSPVDLPETVDDLSIPAFLRRH
jgi:hypothetical protein